MIKANDVGLFGKLPAHGDFIYRDLPSNFINAWDTWLQGFVAHSQQELGDNWLDIYLTSPIWRFAFSDGIFDNHLWTGILLPSVDRVGRYFPFTIATRTPSATTAFHLLQQDNWFTRMEDLALAALDGQLLLDDLVVEINKHKLEKESGSSFHTKPGNGGGSVFQFSDSAASANSAYPYLLDNFLRTSSPTYSLWSTTNGSERVAPLLASAPGLPGLRNTTALLDGNWQDSGWSVIAAAH